MAELPANIRTIAPTDQLAATLMQDGKVIATGYASFLPNEGKAILRLAGRIADIQELPCAKATLTLVDQNESIPVFSASLCKTGAAHIDMFLNGPAS